MLHRNLMTVKAAESVIRRLVLVKSSDRTQNLYGSGAPLHTKKSDRSTANKASVLGKKKTIINWPWCFWEEAIFLKGFKREKKQYSEQFSFCGFLEIAWAKIPAFELCNLLGSSKTRALCWVDTLWRLQALKAKQVLLGKGVGTGIRCEIERDSQANTWAQRNFVKRRREIRLAAMNQACS